MAAPPDANLIAAASSTKNNDGKRDPEMHLSEKGNQWYFGLKAHIGVDTDSELVHIVRDTGVHVADVTKGNSLLHGEDTVVFTDADFQGADKRLDAKPGLFWQVAMRPGKRQNLDEASSSIDALMDKVEKLEVRIWAKVEHPFRVVKKQLGCVKARYRGLKKNILQLKGAVWAVQFMDGQASLDCNARISAS